MNVFTTAYTGCLALAHEHPHLCRKARLSLHLYRSFSPAHFNLIFLSLSQTHTHIHTHTYTHTHKPPLGRHTGLFCQSGYGCFHHSVHRLPRALPERPRRYIWRRRRISLSYSTSICLSLHLTLSLVLFISCSHFHRHIRTYTHMLTHKLPPDHNEGVLCRSGNGSLHHGVHRLSRALPERP